MSRSSALEQADAETARTILAMARTIRDLSEVVARLEARVQRLESGCDPAER